MTRAFAVLLSVFLFAACGGGVAEPIQTPTPTPTPAPGPSPSPTPTPATGSVSGTVAAAPSSRLDARRFPRARLLRASGRPTRVPDQILVKLRDAVALSGVLEIHRHVGGSVVGVIPQARIQIVRLSSAASMAAALALYRSSRFVEYAEQDAYAYLSATPNDQHYPLQWHYPQINLPAAWDVATGTPVIVAVLDSGIRQHPDLSGITVPGFDFFDNDGDPTDPGCASNDRDISHGMHVSGTVAAVTNNGAGVAGVNWGGSAATKIMPLRVGGERSGNCGAVLLSAVVSALHYAADHGAKIANMSIGGPVNLNALREAVDYAHGKGVTLIAAAGNDNNAVDFPAAYQNVIAVAATACNSEKASYSDHGPEIDVAAPGGDLVDCTGDGFDEFVLSPSWSPATGNDYFFSAGTSMAAPHVAGLAALLIARGWTTPADIQARLQTTATDRGTPGFDEFYGWGQVNAGAALGVSRPPAILRAFSGVRAGQTMTAQSSVVEVSSSGSFLITNAQSGTKSVFVWQDYNANSLVDGGDVYGQVDGVTIQPGATTAGVQIVAQAYSGPPISVVGAAGARR